MPYFKASPTSFFKLQNDDIKKDMLVFCIKSATTGLIFYFGYKVIINAMDPHRKANAAAKKRVAILMKMLNIDPRIEFTDYEIRMASLMVPNEDGIDWTSIGGCEQLLSDLKDSIILPLRLKAANTLPHSVLFSPAKGILLHGPPGCGKTLIARAVARAANAKFIQFDLSIMTDKWYGESQKFTAALFSLAKKIQPCIIFIDEIDSFLRSRNSMDHESTAMMKAQFMSLWDGFTASDDNIIVLGATNRPNDIDPAILRRLPLRFQVPLPSLKNRIEILKVILKDEYVSPIVNYDKIAEMTINMSGSDLKEVCRQAALHRLKVASDSNNDFSSMNLEISEEDILYSTKKFMMARHAIDRVPLQEKLD